MPVSRLLAERFFRYNQIRKDDPQLFEKIKSRLMFVNGYIIQKYVDNGYKGVDGSGFSADSGENWYLNSVEGYSEEFEPYFDKEICKDEWYFEPHTYVGVCTDLEYIKRYISVSKKLGIKYRVLVVMTDIPSLTVELDPSM